MLNTKVNYGYYWMNIDIDINDSLMLNINTS